jgi:DNA-binding CsgD family transcriptional regulator
VLERDPLMRLLVLPAVVALGFSVTGEVCADVPEPAAVFVPLCGAGDCRRACATARGGKEARGRATGAAPLVVGYAAGPPGLLAAHRAHGCADLVVRLVAAKGEACFAHLPAGDAVAAAGLSRREADVLVLLLGGLTTAAVACRLGVSHDTARTHCRAVLRKLGAADRRVLRAALLAGDEGRPLLGHPLRPGE